MIQKTSEFLKTLPRKKCTKCGNDMQESHECYGSKCDACLDVYKR